MDFNLNIYGIVFDILSDVFHGGKGAGSMCTMGLSRSDDCSEKIHSWADWHTTTHRDTAQRLWETTTCWYVDGLWFNARGVGLLLKPRITGGDGFTASHGTIGRVQLGNWQGFHSEYTIFKIQNVCRVSVYMGKYWITNHLHILFGGV